MLFIAMDAYKHLDILIQRSYNTEIYSGYDICELTKHYNVSKVCIATLLPVTAHRDLNLPMFTLSFIH